MTKAFHDYLLERQQVPEVACQFITQAIEDNGQDQLKLSLEKIVRAYGTERISKKTGVTRQAIYKMLSRNGNPTYKNLIAILNVFGLELIVKPIK